MYAASSSSGIPKNPQLTLKQNLLRLDGWNVLKSLQIQPTSVISAKPLSTKLLLNTYPIDMQLLSYTFSNANWFIMNHLQKLLVLSILFLASLQASAQTVVVRSNAVVRPAVKVVTVRPAVTVAPVRKRKVRRVRVRNRRAVRRAVVCR